MVRTITQSYEVSSESGRERHVRIPWTRLADQTPTLHDPARVTGRVDGAEMCGTVVNAGTATVDETVILNVAEGAGYRHNVRNVLTYTAGPVAEATFGAINVGDPVYYDTEQDTLNGIKLSTAPVQSDATTLNPLFGYVVMLQDESASDFPKGDAGGGTTHECAVLQAGLNVRD